MLFIEHGDYLGISYHPICLKNVLPMKCFFPHKINDTTYDKIVN